MPAKSKSQQRLFGMVHACQKTGKCASPEVSKVAGTIKEKDATDFAKTKHKGLPNKKKKKKVSAKKVSAKKRKTFKEFIEQKGGLLTEGVQYKFARGQRVHLVGDKFKVGTVTLMVPGNGSIPFYEVEWDDGSPSEMYSDYDIEADD